MRCKECGRDMEHPVDPKSHLFPLTNEERAYLCEQHGYRMTDGTWIGWRPVPDAPTHTPEIQAKTDDAP